MQRDEVNSLIADIGGSWFSRREVKMRECEILNVMGNRGKENAGGKSAGRVK